MEDSFDLSEVSNIVNNDSDGHLLAQYLKKKSGKVITRRIFGAGNESPMNIEVCLRKAENNEKENKKEHKQSDGNPRKSLNEVVADKNINFPAEQTNNLNIASPLNPTRRSPLASYLRRTPHSADKLRQSTLKRLANRYPQRSLLADFDNTSASSTGINGFRPCIASTPLYSDTIEKQNTLDNAKRTPNKGTPEQPAAPSSPRRYTIEKGKSPGQLLLTPLSSPNKDNPSVLNLLGRIERCDEHVPAQKELAMQRSLPPHNATSKEQISVTPKKLDNQNSLVVHVMPNSPQASNIQINCTDHQVILTSRPSATTEPIPTKSRLVTQQPISSPLRPSAIDNTLERTTNVENQCGVLVATQSENNNFTESDSENINAGTFTVQPKIVSSPMPNTENLSEIVTEDEEPAAVATIRGNVRKVNISTRQRVKRSSQTRKHLKRKSKSNTSAQLQTSDNNTSLTDTDTCKPSVSRRRLPLNKAPRTPINGEKYADELKKFSVFSSREVLDLRRRKSSLSKNKQKKSSTKSSSIDEQNAMQDHNLNRKSKKKHLLPHLDSNQYEKEDPSATGSERFEEIVNNENNFYNDESNEVQVLNQTPTSTQPRIDPFEAEIFNANRKSKRKHPLTQLDSNQNEKEDPINNEEDNRNECNIEEDNEEVLSASPTGSERFEEIANNQKNFYNDEANEIQVLNKNPTSTQPQTDPFETEIFEDETSSDRVIFSTKSKKKEQKNGKKVQKRNKETPDIYKSYMNATQRISRNSRKLNESKRSLYSANEIEESPVSPTSSSVGIVSPPLLFRSSTPRKRQLPSPARSPLRSTSPKTFISNEQPQCEEENNDVFKKPKGRPLKKKKEKTFISNEQPQCEEENNDVFKKPKGVPLKRKKTQKTTKNNEHEKNTQTTIEEESTLRRSKRERKQVPIPLFYVMLEKNLIDSREKSKQRKINASKIQKSLSRVNNTDNEMIPIASSTANPLNSVSKKKPRKYTQQNVLPEIQEDAAQSDDIAHNDIIAEKTPKSKSSQPNKLPEIHENEQLPISETNENNENATLLPTISHNEKQKTKNLRVKIQRLNGTTASEQSRNIQSEISSSTSPSRHAEHNGQSNFSTETSSIRSDLVTLLKNLNNEKSMSNTNTKKSFNHMTLSTLDELTFTNFLDVDYAFYNTKERNMGYMRFQPHQTKRSSRVKQELNLLVLSGEFHVISEGETVHLKESGLISINPGVRYSIVNLCNDVSIILFIKR